MKSEVREIKTADVIFREDLYPRIKKSPETVQKYAADLSVLPAIEVNQRNELIDGWNRWTAHKKKDAETIRVFVTETASDAEFLELACERNSAHGLQLSQEDKKDMACRIYNGTPEKERDKCKKRLEKTLSVSERTIRDWLSRIDKDAKEKQKRQVFDLWLACCTQDEIAERVGWERRTVGDLAATFGGNGKIAEFAKTSDSNGDSEDASFFALTKAQQADADHATDFEAPIYNVWKQQKKTEGSKHFGNSEVRWVDNLLYLYTQPFDVVIDPFAGGGSTIDVCRKRLRRYLVSDRKPSVEHADAIRTHDVTEGLLKPPQWKDVRLVYLDPPYWKQAEGEYSTDPTDLANMTLEEFNATLTKVIKGYAAKMKDGGGVIALLMQPTQWNAHDRQFTDHVGDMLRLVNLPVEMRISAPYESQQCNAQMVEWAKSQKKCLVLTREFVVWKVAKQ